MWSQTCEYALRAATYIAQHGQDRPVLAREIADEMNISLQYLQKVLRGLVLAGVLTSTRGIGGGFRLSKPAEKVPLADVVGPFDTMGSRTSCPFGNPRCGQRNPCPVHAGWSAVVAKYAEFLEQTTLRDLVVKAKRARAPKRRRVKK